MPYTQENLKLALDEVWNKGGKTRAVSRKYGIPHTTLLDKLKFKTPIDAKRGPATVLTKEEEHLLVEWTKAMCRKGMPVNQHQFMDTVGRIIERDGRKTPFNAMKPGRKWMQLFIKRHPDISLCQPKAVGVTKTYITETAVRQWHKSLANYILERTGSSDLLSDPRRIINGNESVFFTNSSLSLVLAPKKSKGVCTLKGNEKEMITVLSTITAYGDLIPPCVIYPYEQIPREIVQDINPDWSVGKSITGCLTAEIFHCYIANTLIPFLKKSETPFPVLLVVDSLSSYISLQISHLCQTEGIILYSLLPNATHLLQPAECGIFGPMKRKWRTVVEDFKVTTNENSLTLVNFASLLEQTMDSLDSDAIKHAFEKCGLYPFDEEAIDFSKCICFDNKTINLPRCNLDLAQYLFVESMIPSSRIAQFRESPNEWKGDESAKELFYFWKNLKNHMFGDMEIENIDASTGSYDELVTHGNESLSVLLDKAGTKNSAMPSSSTSKAGPSWVMPNISPTFITSILRPCSSSVGKKHVEKRVTFSTAVETEWKECLEKKEAKKWEEEENERKKLKMVNDLWSEKMMVVDDHSIESEESEEDEEKMDDGEEISLNLEADELDVDLTHCRIREISNFERLTAVETLCFRNNLIKKIENLHTLTTLRELELYDNQITKIENLDSLVNLEILDISFNRITKIENLDNLVNLRKLFLINNKISKIENLDHLENLEMLELGSNKIRVIENLGGLKNLTNLFLGKNRISKMQNLDVLENLELLSLQSNRITKVEGLEKCLKLEHLYLSHNGITEIQGLENNVKLQTLDMTGNKIKRIANIDHLEDLEEFWFNDNSIDSWDCVEVLKKFKKLETVYLEHNPIAEESTYRKKIKLLVPWIKQIDATMAQAT